MCVCLCVSVCVRACVRESEREECRSVCLSVSLSVSLPACPSAHHANNLAFFVSFLCARVKMLYRLEQLLKLGFKPHWIKNLRHVLSQPYSGDVTVTPPVSFDDYLQ